MLTSDFGWNYTRKSTPLLLKAWHFWSPKMSYWWWTSPHFFSSGPRCEICGKKGHLKNVCTMKTTQKLGPGWWKPTGKDSWRAFRSWEIHNLYRTVSKPFFLCVLIWEELHPKELGMKSFLTTNIQKQEVKKQIHTHTHTYIGVTSVLKFLKGFGMWNTLRVLFPVFLWRRPFFSFVVWSYYDFEIRLMKWGWWALSLGGASGICYMHL